jgi:hypothetical protein
MNNVTSFDGDINSDILNRVARNLETFKIRSAEIADRVIHKEMSFVDGVDLLYLAAVWSGLADSAGDDVVQEIMAAAFSSARPS